MTALDVLMPVFAIWMLWCLWVWCLWPYRPWRRHDQPPHPAQITALENHRGAQGHLIAQWLDHEVEPLSPPIDWQARARQAEGERDEWKAMNADVVSQREGYYRSWKAAEAALTTAHDEHVVREGLAYARGQASVLADVAKLPNPIRQNVPKLFGTEWMNIRVCAWCKAEMADTSATWHPDNGCLYVRACAALTAKEEMKP